MTFPRLHHFAFKLLPAAVWLAGGSLRAGPYSAHANDPGNAFDAPVPGFVGPDGEGRARLENGQGGFFNPRNRVNPIFFGWAVGWQEYLRSDGAGQFQDPALALGPVTGDLFDVVSLGDLSAAQLGNGSPVGKITLQMTGPTQPQPIRNLPGADFVVFENAFVAKFNVGGAGVGATFAELAYVEVSSDGVTFARFPSVSFTPNSPAMGSAGSMNVTNVYNLAGKHLNGEGESWGTPFDLSALANDALVTGGLVDLNNIRYVRLVDIPGRGDFLDASARPIYDPWQTGGSGGFDLEAVGAISVAVTFEQWQDVKGLAGAQRGELADPDGDGVANVLEYVFAMEPLVSDVAQLPVAELDSGQLSISFRRDTRVLNAVVEVLGTDDLLHPWKTIARAEPGGALQAVAPFAPAIQEASASHLASVGVVRRARVAAAPAQRFLRVSVSLLP